MEFSELIKSRYSCKKYDGKPISDEQLEDILKAGQVAPTARNAQEQHIYVLRSEEALAKIDALTPCRYGAPVVLMVAFDHEGAYTHPGNTHHSGVEDASIVATHMMLAAKNAGVDSCWVNCFNPDEAHEAFGLPESEEVVLLLDLGFAAEGAGPLKNHESTKELSELVTYL